MSGFRTLAHGLAVLSALISLAVGCALGLLGFGTARFYDQGLAGAAGAIMVAVVGAIPGLVLVSAWLRQKKGYSNLRGHWIALLIIGGLFACVGFYSMIVDLGDFPWIGLPLLGLAAALLPAPLFGLSGKRAAEHA